MRRCGFTFVTMDDFVNELSKEDCYAGIDVRREYGKLVNWCKVNRKEATKRRFVNWLNRIERPFVAPRKVKLDKPRDTQQPQPCSDEQRAEFLAKYSELVSNLKRKWTYPHEATDQKAAQ